MVAGATAGATAASAAAVVLATASCQLLCLAALCMCVRRECANMKLYNACVFKQANKQSARERETEKAKHATFCRAKFTSSAVAILKIIK